MSESVSEQLHRTVAEGVHNGLVPGELRISDGAAWQLAGELAQLQAMVKPSSQEDIYRDLKAGTARFMGWPVVVAGTGSATA